MKILALGSQATGGQTTDTLLDVDKILSSCTSAQGETLKAK